MTQHDSKGSYKREPSLCVINVFNFQGLPSKISNKYDYMLLEVNKSSGKDADAACQNDSFFYI